jgi:hypothetical protein
VRNKARILYLGFDQHSCVYSIMDKQALFRPFSALTGGKNEKVDHAELHEGNVSGNQGNGEKRELKQRDAMQYLGYSWSTWRKWQIL